MFIEDFKNAVSLAKKTNFVIFSEKSSEIKKIFEKSAKRVTTFLSPDEKTDKISVENIRQFTSLTDSKEKSDHFFVVLEAEKMNPSAENAFLKNLEEPNEKHHFVLVTTSPSALLPTVLSRGQIFFKKEKNLLEKPVDADEKTKALAKKLITADTKTLLELANELSKKKDKARSYSLDVVSVAIELLYKSYFATNQEKFLRRLPNLLKLHENLSKNGHIKLHIIADMI